MKKANILARQSDFDQRKRDKQYSSWNIQSEKRVEGVGRYIKEEVKRMIKKEEQG